MSTSTTFPTLPGHHGRTIGLADALQPAKFLIDPTR
ncbi:MAG: hypothetical protein RLZZ584_3756 [Pseudomonadota bacterium]|jgi:hypothetical protein